MILQGSIFEIAALVAALSWAFTGLISAEPSKALGAIRFVRVRMLSVFVMLGVYVLIVGSWRDYDLSFLLPIFLSGMIGIFLGDTALFMTMNRLGPRRTAMLFSMNAPLTVLLGWVFLGEGITPMALLGVFLVFAGVVLAIAFGKRPSQLHEWEAIKGPLWISLAFGFIAALCQAIGSIIARPVMAAGADPIVTSMIRVGIAGLCLSIIPVHWVIKSEQGAPLTLRLFGLTVFSGFLAMGIGMTLLLFAFSGGDAGIVATLSATTPAMLLPLLWLRTGERPALMAWIGAGLVGLGCWFIFAV